MSLTVIENDLSAVTLSGAAVGSTILCTHADGCQVTLPDDLEDGDWFWLVQGTDSPVTVVGTNFLSPGGASTRGRYSQLSAWYSTIAGKWLLAGDVAVAGSVPVVAATAATLETLPAPYDAVLLEGDVWPYDDTDHSGTGTDKIAADPNQTHYVARAIAPTGVDGAYVRTRPKGIYYLEKFSTEATEQPWLRAIDLMDPGECLILPPDGVWTLDEPLVFEQDGISIRNAAGRRDSAHCVLVAGQNNMDLLTFASAGGVISGVNFYAPSDERNYDEYGTCRGLILDRRGIANGEVYANLDIRIVDCAFGWFQTNVVIVGRNVTIQNCSFEMGQYAIDVQTYTYLVGEATTRGNTRGIRILGNVIHQIGAPANTLDDTAHTAAIRTDIDDDFVGGELVMSMIEVADNQFFRCNCCYDGTITGSMIQNNIAIPIFGPFARINSGDNVPGELVTSIYTGWTPGQISGNTAFGVVETGAATISNTENMILGEKILNMDLRGNNFNNAAAAMVWIDKSYKIHLSGETYVGANMAYGRLAIGDHAAVELGLYGGEGAGYEGSIIDACFIYPDPTYKYAYAIAGIRNPQYLAVSGGMLGTGRTGFISGALAYDFFDTSGVRHTNAKVRLEEAHFYPDSSPAADNAGSAIWMIDDLACGENVALHDCVYLKNDGKWWKANATSAGKTGFIGVVHTGASTSGYPVVIRRGILRWDGANIGAGGKVYVGTTNGGLDVAAPAGAGNVVQMVGYAIALDGGDGMFIDPSPILAVVGAEITDELTALTTVSPGSPDYNIQTLTATGGYGFVTADEGLTVLSVLKNVQARVNELESRLSGLGLIADAD